MHEEVVELLSARRGHFLLESGQHGDLWLDLELLFLRPGRAQPFAIELARRLSRHNVEAVCGPLVEGAFAGLMVAPELDVDFTYAERFAPPRADKLFPVEYRIPGVLQRALRGKRTAIVNDVINAGSAVRGACASLVACGAIPVAIGALVVLGSPASVFAADNNLALETLASLPSRLWMPPECPLCEAGVALDEE